MIDDSSDGIFFSIIKQIELTKNFENVKKVLGKITACYGLAHAAYFALGSPMRSKSDSFFVATYSERWISRYTTKGYVDCDPGLKIALKTLLPVDWSCFDRSDETTSALLNDLETHGIGAQGLTMAVRGMNGQAATFTVTSNDSDEEWQDRKRLILRDLPALALAFHELILRTQRADQTRAMLSPREIECLNWAAQGKTLAEIADILSISDHTARFYLDIARRKLNATNIAHAVAKAVAGDLFLVLPARRSNLDAA